MTIPAAGSSVVAAVTPLTDIAYQMAAGDPAQIAAKAVQVQKAFGLDDVNILTVTPTDVNTVKAKTDAPGRYGTVLAIISQYQKDSALTWRGSLTNLVSSVDSNGTHSLSVGTALQNAADSIRTSSPVQNNVGDTALTLTTKIQTQTNINNVGLKLSAANPGTLIQGAFGASSWTVAGGGIPVGLTFTLNGVQCTSSGTRQSLIAVTGIDCSNVQTQPTDTKATLSVLVLNGKLTGTTINVPSGYIAPALSINLTPPPTSDLAWAVNPTAIKLGGSATISTRSSSAGALTYTSSDPSVATISSAGVVTALAIGKTTITAVQAAVRGQYAATSIAYELTVTERTLPTVSFSVPTKNVTLGSADFSNLVTTPVCTSESSYTPSITYRSADSSKAAVNSATGTVTLKGAGTVTIFADIGISGTCAAGSAFYTLNIAKATPTVSFSSTTTNSIPALSGAFNVAATVAAPSNSGTGALPATSGLTVTYSGNNASIATVSNTGVITPKAAGSVTITAAIAGDNNYLGTSDNSSIKGSYTLVVTNPRVTPDCLTSDPNCGAQNTNTYSQGKTGVWRFDNTSSASINVDVNIAGVQLGNAVTLLFSNGSNDATSAPSVGNISSNWLSNSFQRISSSYNTASATEAAKADAHSKILELNQGLVKNLRVQKANNNLASASMMSPARLLAAVPSITVGTTKKSWIENGFSGVTYDTTARVLCSAGPTGRRVVIWVQDNMYSETGAAGTVSDANLASYQSKFCGTSANNYSDGDYAKIANVLGDVWGDVSLLDSDLISDSSSGKLDINIVLFNPGGGSNLAGYFYGVNNFLKSTFSSIADFSKSNEALAFFINTQFSKAQNQSTLVHELTHMINFYQRGVLKGTFHDTWLEETSAMMTQDIFDTESISRSYSLDGTNTNLGYISCLPVACRLTDYVVSSAGGGNVSYFGWPTTVTSNNLPYYDLGGAFGAYLNRRFGPSIYAKLVACDTKNGNTSFSCLDGLIKQADSTSSFANEFARFGASAFGYLDGGSASPAKYGFPRASGTVPKTANMAGDLVYDLPAFSNWLVYSNSSSGSNAGTLSVAAPAALDFSLHNNKRFLNTSHTYNLDKVSTATSYVRNNISVPANTSLIVVVK